MSTLQTDLKDFEGAVTELKDVVSESGSGIVSESVTNAVVEFAALRAASLLESYLEKVFYHSILGQHPCMSVQSKLAIGDLQEANLLIGSSQKAVGDGAGFRTALVTREGALGLAG